MTILPLACGRFRAPIAVAIIATFAISFSLFSRQEAYGASVNVPLSPEVTAKFPHLKSILQNLLDTLDTPNLWGTNLNLKVPDTGLFSIGKYTIGEINAEYVKYLTDGKLRITFKPEPRKDHKGVAAETYCHTTFSANDVEMGLHPGAGSWRGQTAPYSDYDLAITIYHELLHVWQFHHEVAPSCYIFTKEIPAYFLEKYLPKNLFDTRNCPDPLGSTPVFCPLTGYPKRIDMVFHFPPDKVPSGDQHVDWAYIGQCTPNGDEKTCVGAPGKYGYAYASYGGKLANGQSLVGNLIWGKDYVDRKYVIGPGNYWFFEATPTLPKGSLAGYQCHPDQKGFPNEVVSGNKVHGWCNFGNPEMTFDAHWDP